MRRSSAVPPLRLRGPWGRPVVGRRGSPGESSAATDKAVGTEGGSEALPGGRPACPRLAPSKADGSAARAGPRHRRSRRAHRPRHGAPVRAGPSPLRADAEHQGGRAAQRKDGSSRAAGDKRHLHPRLSCLISCVWATPRVPELGPVVGEPSPVGRLINHLLSSSTTRTRPGRVELSVLRDMPSMASRR